MVEQVNMIQEFTNQNTNSSITNSNDSSGQINSNIVENTKLNSSPDIASKHDKLDSSKQHKTSNFKTYTNKNYRFKNNQSNMNRMPNFPTYNVNLITPYNFVTTNSVQYFFPLDLQQNSHFTTYNNFYNTNDSINKQGYMNHKVYVREKKAEVT
jgi:hypothetical protein